MASYPLNKLGKVIGDAIDKGFRAAIIDTQKQLSERNPVDSGRMASSWFINGGGPSGKVRPEEWAEPGAGRVQVEEFDGEIPAEGSWYLTNNVPYAERIALDPTVSTSDASAARTDPRGGGSGGANWFTDVQNVIAPKLIQSRISAELRKL